MRKQINDQVGTLTKVAEERLKDLEHRVENFAQPTRKTLIERFPVFFTLLVTFGVSTTFLAFEQLILKINFLQNNPSIMLVIGVGILALTGTLYNKLG